MKRTTRKLRSAFLCSTGLIAGMVGAAEMAQAQLDEIIVTATKRERSIQDVPIAVSVFSAETLNLAGVTNIETLQTSVPGLAVSTAQGSGSNTTVRLRGVGTAGNNLGFEGAVGIFVDGAYRSRAGASLGDFPDVERIEVLRGPQGTLFGRNTTAGALHIITKKPKMDEFEAELSATFGNFDRQQVRGVVNFPIVEGKLAGRFAADYHRRDGYLTGIVDPSLDFNDRDRYNLRGSLLWEPTPDIDVRIIGNYFAANESCCAIIRYGDGPLQDAAAAGAFLAFGFGQISNLPSQREDLIAGNNSPTSERQEDRNGQIDVTWRFADNVEFFNSVFYQRYDLGAVNEFDQTQLTFLISPFSAQQVELFTEEFRFSGELNDLPLVQSVNWLVGGYYSSENIGSQVVIENGPDAALLPTLSIGPFTAAFTPGDRQLGVFGQNAKTKAVFSHLDIDVLDWLNVSGGARFTTEDKTGGAVFSTVNLGGPGTFNPQIPAGARPYSANADADEWIGTAALTVKFAEDISVYGSFAHGYKSGGLDLNLSSNGSAGFFPGTVLAALGGAPFTGTVADPTFPLETVNTFELGLKSRLWEDRVTLNVTGYHSTFKNYQVLVFDGLGFSITSAPEVTVQGVETELQVSPVDGLNLSASYNYNYAEYTAPFILGLAGQLEDSRLAFAPLHTSSLRATYRRPIPNTGLVGLLHGEWFYSSNYAADNALQSDRIQNGFSVLNARIGVSSDDDRYALSLWCRNCADQFYTTLITTSPLDRGDIAVIREPLEWGVTLSAKY